MKEDKEKEKIEDAVSEISSNYHWILDAGHGGLHPETGTYQTRGKRSPTFPPSSKHSGQVLYEGVRNRKILEYLTALMKKEGFSYSIVSDEWKDIPLSERVVRANAIAKERDNCIYVSIHHNAYGKGWNNAHGISTYHYPKSEKGFRLAGVFQNRIVEETKWRDRGVKNANFYVLKYTSMPAVLTENGFMTNLKEAEVIMTDKGSERLAKAHLEAMKEIDERGLNFL